MSNADNWWKDTTGQTARDEMLRGQQLQLEEQRAVAEKNRKDAEIQSQQEALMNDRAISESTLLADDIVPESTILTGYKDDEEEKKKKLNSTVGNIL